MVPNPFVIGNTTTLPEIDFYKAPDLEKTIGSSYTCSPATITVAAYQNRSSYINSLGNTQNIGGTTVGERAGFSSIGPTRDKRVKPEITAPGQNILAAAPVHALPTISANQKAQGGWHSIVNGTSFSSPAVAGWVALYLQMKPTATSQEIKTAMRLTARQDAFTGSVPNFEWGYGKLNGFSALNAPLVFGCTDSNALNYNPLANVNDGNCQYPVSVAPFMDERKYCLVYPNPVHKFLIFKINGVPDQLIDITILSHSGNVVSHQEFNSNKAHVVNVAKWSSGLYVLRAVDADGWIDWKKFVVLP